MLKRFKVNKERDLLAPDFECYQMDLTGPVNDAIASGEVDEEFKLLPSWAKFSQNPIKSKGFFSRTLKALFLGQGGHDELNVDLQSNQYGANKRTAMMFLPSNTRNEMLKIIGNIALEVLLGYEVIVLCGDVWHNGKRITNRNAEKVVKEIVEKGKHTLIIAAQMAQRSFSVAQISELYLAYDKGENGATIQKMSRALTPGDIGKVGRIYSLSFDPNRDDKFDSMIIETAINYKRRNGIKSLQEAIKGVLRTIDIFKCTKDGSVKMDVDNYLALAMARKGISRVLGKVVNMRLLSNEDIVALADGNKSYFRNQKRGSAMLGKTRESKKQGVRNEKKDLTFEKQIARAREVITTIIENLDFIIYGTNSGILTEAMKKLESNTDYQKTVEEEFNVPFETISFLFENKVIKQEWVELLYDNN
jgi:hypothetical protein